MLACLAPHVDVLTTVSRPTLFSRQTGRSLALSPQTIDELRAWDPVLPAPPHLRPVAQRLGDLGMLDPAVAAAPPPLDLGDLIPARSRLVLTLHLPQPEGPTLWLPVPSARTAGGYGWTQRPLTAAQLRAWQALNGSRTITQVAHSAHLDLPELLTFLAGLTTPEVQAVQLWSHPLRSREPALLRLVGPGRPEAAHTAAHHGDQGQTALTDYHLDEIVDADTHFDDRETTVAHAFAHPHPALAGQPFGAALHAALEERGLLPDDDGAVLEIGPGTGELGAAFLSRAADRGSPRGEMIRLDQSPELLRGQRRHQPGSRELLGSATDIPLPPNSVSLVLCNEVIADLVSVPCDASQPCAQADALTPAGAADQVRQRLKRYALQPLTLLDGPPLYNLGAWQLLEQLHRVLRPGGTAYLSEFGSLDEQPTPTRFLDHPEVSIHFGQLQQVARHLGFQASCLTLPELLHMDLSSRWLARHSYEGLRARMRSEGRHLQARAWTLATLDLPWRVEGLQEVSIAEEGPAPVPTRFMALLLRKER